MAFNLNKNDGTDLNKKSNSKFNLSKTESRENSTSDKNKGSKTWMFLIFGLLILGIGLWYFVSHSNNAKKEIIQNGSYDETNQNSNIGLQPVKASESGSDKNTDLIVEETSSEIDKGNSSNEEEPKNVSTNNYVSANTVVNDKEKSISSNKQPNINNKVTASFQKASSEPMNIDSEIVKQILDYLENNTNGSITLYGFASSDGDLAVNQVISQSRADNFKKYLVSKGISADKIIAIGQGISDPIASNDTEDGRKKNRRVEVYVN